MVLDAKTATHVLIEIAERIAEELEFYSGSEGMTEDMGEAIHEFGSNVELLRGLHSAAFRSDDN